MTPNLEPQTTTASSEPTEPARPGKYINTAFVKDARTGLTREQLRAMAEHRQASMIAERQWALITGIRLPEW